MPAEYPFSGMDMLQNSMAQLIGELRNVGSAIGQSARSLNNGVMQQSAQMGGLASSFNSAALSASTRVMSAGDGGGNFFKETFSSQFNKPSLWSRDLVAMTGLKEYDDMQRHEVQRYARQNTSRRAESLGVGAARVGAFGASMAIKSTLVGIPVGLAMDYTIGEWAKNVEQEQDWWGYLDKVGKNNVMLGRGSGVHGGWGDAQLKEMSKWLSTQDKTWYSNRQSMNYEDMQSTIKSAEMQGYFHGTVDTKDFNQKVLKLVQNTKDIMKTMKMANDEAAAIIGELSYFGYKDANKTIKQMNRTAAMTGLSFDEVKQYGMEYAKTTYDAFAVNKDASTQLLLSVLSKYEKQDQGGGQVELKGIYKAAGDQTNQLLATKYDAATGRMVLDEEGMAAAAGMSPQDAMRAADAKIKQLWAATGGDGYKAGMVMNDLQHRGASMILSASPDVLQSFAFGTNMAGIKMAMETLASTDPNSEMARAIQQGGDDPRKWLEFLGPEGLQTLAGMYAQQNPGTSMGDALKMLQGNTPGMGITQRKGPLSIDEITSDWHVKGPKNKLSDAYRHPETQWQWLDAYKTGNIDTSLWQKDMGGVTDQKYKILGGTAGFDPMAHIMWMNVANNPLHKDDMEAIEDKMFDVTGYRGFTTGDRAHGLIYALGAQQSMTDYDARSYIRNLHREYYDDSLGMTTTAAYDKAKQFDYRSLQRFMVGDTATMQPDIHKEMLEKYGKYRTMNMYGTAAENHYSSLSKNQQKLELINFSAAKAAAGTQESAAAKLKALKAGTKPWEAGDWSPELYRMTYLDISTKSNLTDWERAIKAGGEELFGQLDEKGKGFYRAAMEADNPKDYAKNLIKLTNRKYKNVDSTDMGAILTKLNAEQSMGIQTPNAGVVGTSGLNAVGQKTELMGEIASSGYAELFQTPLARQYMSQLADPDSELAQRAKTPGGKAAVANMITEQLARVSQENGVTMTAEGKADVRSIAIRAAGGDEEMRKQMAIEINRGQDDVKSKLDTSNIYLQSLDQNMAKTSKISDASGGYALRVVVYENSTAGYGGAKKHHESMASVKP